MSEQLKKEKEEFLKVLTILNERCQELSKKIPELQKELKEIETAEQWFAFNEWHFFDYFNEAMYSLEDCC